MTGAGVLTPSYMGPAPGKIGVDQVNALGQWKGGPQGCRVPMYLTDYSSAASQLVNVSIHTGGGACVDPPGGTLGMITWERTSISDVGVASSRDAVVAQFIQAEELGFPDPGVSFAYAGGTTCCLLPPQPAICDASLPATLDAGDLRFSGPGIGSLTLAPSTQNGRITYEAVLPAGTLQGGDYQVAGSGGAQVGVFAAKAHIPAPIAITNKLEPGTRLLNESTNDFTLQWTGGDDSSLVTVQVIVRSSNFQLTTAAYASAGPLMISGSIFQGPCMFSCVPMFIPPGDVELIVTQSPVTQYPLAPIQPFTAPGLGIGGEQTWKYVFDFRGLKN